MRMPYVVCCALAAGCSPSDAEVRSSGACSGADLEPLDHELLYLGGAPASIEVDDQNLLSQSQDGALAVVGDEVGWAQVQQAMAGAALRDLDFALYDVLVHPVVMSGCSDGEFLRSDLGLEPSGAILSTLEFRQRAASCDSSTCDGQWNRVALWVVPKGVDEAFGCTRVDWSCN